MRLTLVRVQNACMVFPFISTFSGLLNIFYFFGVNHQAYMITLLFARFLGQVKRKYQSAVTRIRKVID